MVWQAWKRSLQALRALGLVTYVKSRCSGAGIARLMGRFPAIGGCGGWCRSALLLDGSNGAIADTVAATLIGSSNGRREGDLFCLAAVFLLHSEGRRRVLLKPPPLLHSLVDH